MARGQALAAAGSAHDRQEACQDLLNRYIAKSLAHEAEVKGLQHQLSHAQDKEKELYRSRHSAFPLICVLFRSCSLIASLDTRFDSYSIGLPAGTTGPGRSKCRCRRRELACQVRFNVCHAFKVHCQRIPSRSRMEAVSSRRHCCVSGFAAANRHEGYSVVCDMAMTCVAQRRALLDATFSPTAASLRVRRSAGEVAAAVEGRMSLGSPQRAVSAPAILPLTCSRSERAPPLRL
jgi:hypothetical protein